MKTRNKKIYVLLFAVMLMASSCDSFLNNPLNSSITGQSLSSDNLPALTAPLYNRVWFDFNDKFCYGLGDGMSYNLRTPSSDYIYPFGDLQVNGLTGPLSSAWNSFYQVVQQANTVIKSINESSADQSVKDQYIAEARFMRGTAYWHLASLWQDVPIVEDPVDVAQNPQLPPNQLKDVFEYAIRDLEFAAKYLPETSPQVGRVNRYSAFGMLSRLYLAYSGFVASNYGQNPNVGTRDQSYLDLAKQAAEKVINNSTFKLMANYPDLFKVENNNNSESLFAFQWVPSTLDNTNGGYGVINSQQAFFAANNAIVQDGTGWGGDDWCSYDMIMEYASNDTIRRKATWMGYDDYYPEINGGYTYTLNESSNISGTSKGLNIKKGVVGKAGVQSSGLDNYMLRLAEVYLNYAEAILGNDASTSNATALQYFNAVRARAGLESKTSIAYEDIRKERRIEFCMEGRYWYDLVSRAYYKQQEVVDYINVKQNRGVIPAFVFKAPNYVAIDPDSNAGTRAVGTASAATFKLPYPETDLIIDPKLADAPVPFTFTEDRITDLFK